MNDLLLMREREVEFDKMHEKIEKKTMLVHAKKYGFPQKRTDAWNGQEEEVV